MTFDSALALAAIDLLRKGPAGPDDDDVRQLAPTEPLLARNMMVWLCLKGLVEVIADKYSLNSAGANVTAEEVRAFAAHDCLTIPEMLFFKRMLRIGANVFTLVEFADATDGDLNRLRIMEAARLVFATSTRGLWELSRIYNILR